MQFSNMLQDFGFMAQLHHQVEFPAGARSKSCKTNQPTNIKKQTTATNKPTHTQQQHTTHRTVDSSCYMQDPKAVKLLLHGIIH